MVSHACRPDPLRSSLRQSDAGVVVVRTSSGIVVEARVVANSSGLVHDLVVTDRICEADLVAVQAPHVGNGTVECGNVLTAEARHGRDSVDANGHAVTPGVPTGSGVSLCPSGVEGENGRNEAGGSNVEHDWLLSQRGFAVTPSGENAGAYALCQVTLTWLLSTCASKWAFGRSPSPLAPVEERSAKLL